MKGPACRTCGRGTTVVTGACGTWIRCPAAHEQKVVTDAARRASLTLTCAIRDKLERAGWSAERQADYDDRMHILREHTAHQWRLAHAAFGLDVP